MHVARWDNFGYNGQPVDRGQIIDLVGLPNDEKLIRLGYIVETKEKSPTVLECGECGALFLEDAARNSHGRRRHPHRERLPSMAPISVHPVTGEPSGFVDTDGDREENQRERDTPLYLENTEASRK